MPATSPAQKHLMCMALAYKRHGASVLRDLKNKKEVIKVANSMTEGELKDFCLPAVKGG
jgi:hypothetical protein